MFNDWSSNRRRDSWAYWTVVSCGFWWWGSSSESVPGYVDFRGGPRVADFGGSFDPFLGGVSSGILPGKTRRDGVRYGVRVVFTSMSRLKSHPKIFVFMFCITCFLYKQFLQWWFNCMRMQTWVGPVCVRSTTLMCRGRECAPLDSVTTWKNLVWSTLIG
jgi:hypothetical protein